MESRIINGFDYFWNKKPSDFTDKDVLLLHHWMGLFKDRINFLRNCDGEKKIKEVPETADELYEVAKQIFQNA